MGVTLHYGFATPTFILMFATLVLQTWPTFLVLLEAWTRYTHQVLTKILRRESNAHTVEKYLLHLDQVADTIVKFMLNLPKLNASFVAPPLEEKKIC